MAIINSSWAQVPILLTDGLNDPKWTNPGKMAIPGGFLMVKNDANFLYAALDMTADTGNDPGTGDYFWFTFDRNRDGNITPNVDSNYGNYPGFPNKMGRQWYLSPGTWTGLHQDGGTCRQAFEPSPNSAAAHRIWKFKFLLTDINVSLTPWWWASFTKFGIKVHSSNPVQDNITPPNFWQNFANLHTLYFSRKPTVDLALQGPVMGCVGLIPSTKINAAGRATTDPAYFVAVQNAAFGGLLNIIGNAPKRASLWTAGARFIKVFHSEGAAPFTEFRTAWYNYRWNAAAGDYVLDSFGPDGSNFYPLQDIAVDYSIHDLLFQFDSSKLANGLHRFQVKFYNAAKVEIPAFTPPATIQTLSLLIDNSLPVVKVNNIFHGGAAVAACDIITMTSATDGVTVNFDANDPEGNLRGWTVSAQWGDGASAILGTADYAPALGNWAGVTAHTIPSPGVWVPVKTCAHAFTIWAGARTTNGYSYIGETSVSRFITIKK